MNIQEKVYSYPTKNKEGFTNNEIDSLLKEFSGLKMEKINNAFTGNTCMMIDNEIINYHCDVYKALLCGIENRDLTVYEWD